MRYVIGAAGGVVVFMVLMLILALSVPVVPEVRQAKAVTEADGEGYSVSTTTEALCTANVSLYYSLTDLEYSKSFVKFELPDLGGATIVSATLKLYDTNTTYGALHDVKLYGFGGDPVAWSEDISSRPSDTTDMGDLVQENITLDSTSAMWYSFDVTDEIVADYGAGNTERSFTLYKSGYTTPDRRSLDIGIGSDDAGTYHQFADKAHPTYYPRIEIITEDEDPGGGTGPGGWPAGTPQVRHGGTVGVLFG